MTLLEVLIALVVLTVGLLGVAALNVKTLSASRAALLRSRAVLLAGDMVDRIRANRHPDDAYDCDGICMAGAGGNSMAVQDIADWTQAVTQELPAGRAEITRHPPASGMPPMYVVRVSWDEPDAGTRGTFALMVCVGEST